MTDNNNGSNGRDWIVNENLGHTLFNRVKGSTQVRFTDGVAVLAKLVQFGEDNNLVRMASLDYDDTDDWGEPFSLANPGMRVSTSFNYKLRSKNIRSVKMAVYGRTIHGANFVHEFTQDSGDDAEAIIRCPVPDSLRDEALSIADGYPNCEMVREQAGAFQDRFNVTDESPPGTYWEPHIKCTGVKSQEEILEVFDEVLDVVERGVRSST